MIIHINRPATLRSLTGAEQPLWSPLDQIDVEYDPSAALRFRRILESCRRENLVVEGFSCGIAAHYSLLAFSLVPRSPSDARFVASGSAHPAWFLDIALHADLNLRRTELRPILNGAQCVALADLTRERLRLDLLALAVGSEVG